jgi:hypothetical protein
MQEELKQPFFVQLLQCQRQEENSQGITKPYYDPPDQTHKFPSDGDEEWDFTS